eukprot:gene26860-35552_t
MTFREALLTSTSNGDIDIIKALMGSARWKKEYLQCFFGPESLLMIAAKAGYSEIVELFLDAGAVVDERRMGGKAVTALFLAVQGGHVDTAKLLLSRGADMAFRSALNGRTVFLEAVWQGHTPVVNLLLDCGANVDETYELGRSALHVAAHRGNIKVLKLLLAWGADITARDSFGNTAIGLSGGRADVIEVIQRAQVWCRVKRFVLFLHAGQCGSLALLGF